VTAADPYTSTPTVPTTDAMPTTTVGVPRELPRTGNETLFLLGPAAALMLIGLIIMCILKAVALAKRQP